MQEAKRTAVLVDRHPMWLDALKRVLADAGVAPVGMTTDGREAVALVKEHRPHLLVAEAEPIAGAGDRFALLTEARTHVPSLKVVVVSASEDPTRIDAALSAGAVAYVLKRAQPEDVTSAIRQVFSPSLFLAGNRVQSRPPRLDEAADDAGLTRREREILALVAEGGTNREVAQLLWVTEQTVKFHLANIFRKLDVTNRTQASRWAHAHGIVGEQSDEHRSELVASV
jgi:DNA-binding NarL/FixJ family response regulator